MMTGQVRGLLQTAAKVTGDNYPENMGCMFVVNAPFVFSAAWSIVKGFLDERTVAKIKINPKQKEIFECIDENDLPVFLGGKCNCPGGCMKSEAGPWSEFEAVVPFGIKPKGEAVA